MNVSASCFSFTSYSACKQAGTEIIICRRACARSCRALTRTQRHYGAVFRDVAKDLSSRESRERMREDIS